jgi:hypothetical protein
MECCWSIVTIMPFLMRMDDIGRIFSRKGAKTQRFSWISFAPLRLCAELSQKKLLRGCLHR